MRKGITPVITVILLVFIAISMVGMFMMFAQDWMTGMTSKMFEISPGSAFCQNGLIKVYILNTGSGPLTANDIVLAEVGGTQTSIYGLPIAKGKSALVINHTCVGTSFEIPNCPTTLPSGQGCCMGGTYYSVRVGTSSVFKEQSIFCP